VRLIPNFLFSYADYVNGRWFIYASNDVTSNREIGCDINKDICTQKHKSKTKETSLDSGRQREETRLS